MKNVSQLRLASQRRRNLIVLAAYTLLCIPIIVYFKINFFVTTIILFGVPSVYLIYLKPSNLKKSLIGGLLFGVLWGFSFDFIAELNSAWSWSAHNSLLFPDQFLGVVSLDVMVWFFLWVFYIIAFYEYFIEFDHSKKISPNFKYSILFGSLTLIGVVVIYWLDPESLHFQYTYLIMGTLAVLQFIYIMIRRPKLLPKTLKVIPFFFFVYLIFELIAMYLVQWTFPGQYIGSVSFGGLSFPIEELLFWVIISSGVGVSYHELFVDDGK